jgi:uncharacterized protein YjbI with pentapeptide repeats
MDTNIEQNLLKLKALNACLGCDLSGADLSKAGLSGVNLSGAKLSNAYLSGADLTGATLKNAKIEGAIFCNTKTPWGLDNSGCKKE